MAGLSAQQSPSAPAEPSPVGALTVSVVICAYTFDRLETVRAAVSSVTSQSPPPREVILVVDHNRELRDRLTRDCASGTAVRVLENTAPPGLSGARNTGVAAASGDIIFFLDDDARAEPGCIAACLAPFADPSVAGVMARISADCIGGRPGWFPDEFLWTVGCSYQGLAAGRVRNLIGAGMFVRTDVLRRTGGFESSLGRGAGKLPLGCEETAFCIRVSREIPGSIFAYEPSGSVSHVVPPERLTWRYLAVRCYAEGISKARLAGLEGSRSSLSSERNYVRTTLRNAVVRNTAEAVRKGSLSAAGRTLAIGVGLASAAAGYAVEKLRLSTRRFLPRDEAGGNQPQQASNTTSAPSGSVAAPDASLALPSGKRSLQDRAAELLKRVTGSNHDLFSNAGLFAIGTAISSALGFVYWWFAARYYPSAAVGLAAGAVSLMNFIGHFGEIGLGALLMGELHRAGGRVGTVFTTSLAVALAASVALGLGALAATSTLNLSLGAIADTSLGELLFLLGCGLTGLTLVLDQGMVGLLISGKQVQRNVTFAVSKFLILIAIPVLIARTGRDEVAILATWVIGQAISVALLAADLQRTRAELLSKPEAAVLKPLTGSIIGHHVLNLANLAPSLLLPFIVTVQLSPVVNAAFFAAWMMVTVSYLVPASLSTVLYTVASRGPEMLKQKLKASLASSLAFGAFVSAVFFFFSDLVLGMFNEAYPAIAGNSLKWLGLSIFPTIIKYHYVAIQRVHGRMLFASVLVAAGCVIELAGALLGAREGTLDALTRNWLLCFTLESLVMLPVVLSALGIGSADFAGLRRLLPAALVPASAGSSKGPDERQ